MRLVTQRGISPTNKAGRESSSRERFPSFEDTHPNLSLPPVFESPRDSSPQSAGISPARWTAKQASFEQTPWRTSHHKPRRSVSEAIHRIRTRDGSVSENAHELAVALKAPVSWKLIVSTSGSFGDLDLTTFRVFLSFGTTPRQPRTPLRKRS